MLEKIICLFLDSNIYKTKSNHLNLLKNKDSAI